jgi:hypothetical protein
MVRNRLHRRRYSAQPVVVESERRLFRGRSGFDFDKGNGSAAASDQVHFTDGSPDPRCDDAPSLEAEPPGGEGLGPAAAALGAPALHLSRCARS